MNKAAPSVTDSDFEIRTPGFIVVYGYVVHVMAVQLNKERIMKAGDSVSYKRHGSFQVCCIHDGHATIKHTTLSGKVMTLLVPDKQWLKVSNGSYKTYSPNYASYETFYSRLKNEPLQPRSAAETLASAQMLAERYKALCEQFHHFKEYQADFPLYSDEDTAMTLLQYRIDYGWLCTFEGQPIPPDCEMIKLLIDFHELVSKN